MSHHIVVPGAGYAGSVAVKRVARPLRHIDVNASLVNAGERFAERVRPHRLAVGHRLRDLPLRDPVHGTGIELVRSDALLTSEGPGPFPPGRSHPVPEGTETR
ncbi:hypothetical protein [Embleya sp. NBC_00896]|uniref:hypothetical protein n=1 Tax=Embleya sp. NBC_00896 TaxID=2975961 RepID=UPI002F90DAB6|nr:hypothetical protein OG928_44500 [Embleya sp. NBC_00896]